MKNMKKSIILFGAVAIALLMVSSATAVPRTNSEPMMEKIEQIEELERLMSEQNLGDLFNFEGMDEGTIQGTMEQLNNFMVEQGIDGLNFQEMYTNFSVEDFMDYITSDGFAELFNHDDIQNLLDSDDYNNYIINNETVASFINSEFLNSFLVCDFAQQILNNIKGEEGSSAVVSQTTEVINRQTTSTQQNLLIAGEENLILEGTFTINSEEITQINSEDATTLFNAMLVGSFAYILGGPEPQFSFQEFIFWFLLIVLELTLDLLFALATLIEFTLVAIAVIAVAMIVIPLAILLGIIIFPFYVLAVIIVGIASLFGWV